MKDLNKMRLGVIRELKNLRYFLDELEKGVKRRDAFAISRAYIFLNNLVYHMDNGDLTPESIELTHALLLSADTKGLTTHSMDHTE